MHPRSHQQFDNTKKMRGRLAAGNGTSDTEPLSPFDAYAEREVSASVSGLALAPYQHFLMLFFEIPVPNPTLGAA
jgi:hypothetical protein